MSNKDLADTVFDLMPEDGNPLLDAIKRAYGPTFTHWSKDPLVPYEGCYCLSCGDARLQVILSTTHNTGEGV